MPNAPIAEAPVAPANVAGYEKAMSAARLYLWSNFPFLYWLLNELKLKATEEVDTAAVDANDNLYVNPAFFVGLEGVKERAFLLAHEVLHPALGIFWRSAGHDREIANIAHDFVINLILKGEDSTWVIKSALLSDDYKDLGYEQVYALLAKEVKGAGRRPAKPGQGSVSVGSLKLPMSDVVFDKSLDGQRVERAAEERQAKEWAARIVAAQLFSDSMGKRSLSAQRCLDLAHRSTTPWQELLRQSVTEAIARSRLDWNTPHRRSDSYGIYMPRETLVGCEVTVAVDTSGSVSDENAESALSEIRSIIEAAGGSVRWLVGDTQVLSDEIIHDVPDRIAGCGGTDFRPFFDHLESSGKPTRMLVYFTDTYGEFPADPPRFPVIWAVYENNTEVSVPFGDVIKIPAALAAA